MPLTNIDIINQALARIGAHPIADLTDPSASAEIAGQLYDMAVDDVLAAHPWRAATRTIDYTSADQTDLPDYSNGFILPTDCRPARRTCGA